MLAEAGGGNEAFEAKPDMSDCVFSRTALCFCLFVHFKSCCCSKLNRRLIPPVSDDMCKNIQVPGSELPPINGTPTYRRAFTCGLWSTFHSLTVQANESTVSPQATGLAIFNCECWRRRQKWLWIVNCGREGVLVFSSSPAETTRAQKQTSSTSSAARSAEDTSSRPSLTSPKTQWPSPQRSGRLGTTSSAGGTTHTVSPYLFFGLVWCVLEMVWCGGTVWCGVVLGAGR